MKNWLIFLCAILAACGSSNEKQREVQEVSLSGGNSFNYPEKLSEWALFEPATLNQLVPAKGVMPYEINSPLFSDYAEKKRFVKWPAGKEVTHRPHQVLEFPEGTVLIKNFYYSDVVEPRKLDVLLLETRLLVRDSLDWTALTYVWNEEQSEAFLEISGSVLPVSWKRENGVLSQVNYSVPNLVQCKGCHERNGKMTPIGPSVRQLNRDVVHEGGFKNQLTVWKQLGLIKGLPAIDEVPKLAQWENQNELLTDRARAWLEINCAHCHQSEGPAKNTGLYLTHDESDRYRLGIMKPPVAAGRGSMGLRYGIVPGHPEQSILLRRIESLDPGVMMPEMGRKLRHEEGIALIREWIAAM